MQQRSPSLQIATFFKGEFCLDDPLSMQTIHYQNSLLVPHLLPASTLAFTMVAHRNVACDLYRVGFPLAKNVAEWQHTFTSFPAAQKTCKCILAFGYTFPMIINFKDQYYSDIIMD